MRKEKGKQLLICAVGVMLSCGSIYGINPFGLIFFSAMYMERVCRIILCPLLTIALTFVLPLDQMLRYVIPMIVTIVVVRLLEGRHRICRKWKGYVISGLSLLSMDVAGSAFSANSDMVLITGVLESILVISASFLTGGILRFLLSSERKIHSVNKKEELFLKGPGRGRLLAYAESFRNLAKTFAYVPEETAISVDGEGGALITTAAPMQEALHDRREMLWKSRFMENRVVLAGQLNEMAHIISEVAEEIYNVVDVGEKLEERIRKRLRREGVISKNILVVEKKEHRIEVYVTLKMERRNKVAVKEIAELLSEVCRKNLVPSAEGAMTIGREYATVFFEEDAAFRVLTGVARLPKEGEEISGDNYAFTKVGPGRVVVSLSDGMGSGSRACKESETIIELTEQFLEAGFSGEAVVQMINGAMVARSEEQAISSLDIADIDLYSGVCKFIKVGASTTFIKRDTKVETLVSTSLPLGIFHRQDFDCIEKKLYDEDYIILVTDGVLDRVGGEQPEEALCRIIEKTKRTSPREMSSKILNKVMAMSHQEVKDDMSVLVAGIWKK